MILETTKSGTLLNRIDLSVANPATPRTSCSPRRSRTRR